MSSIANRIERAEQALSMSQEPLVIEVVDFSGGPSPPERREGNVIIRHVSYESMRERLEGGAARERGSCENGNADGIRQNPTN